MRHAAVLLVLVLLGAAPAAQDAGRRPIPPDQVQAAVARADEAIAELQKTLVGRLKEELGRGGPAAAVTVCRDEAQQLTRSIGERHGLEIGRTSHRVRNPVNEPRGWARHWIASWAGARAADAKPATYELDNGRLGVLRPIGTMDLCVMCHGQPEAVEAVIGDVLRESYPDDRATGFAPGDLRGWFWAEVPVN